jgi:hypothetical protein
MFRKTAVKFHGFDLNCIYCRDGVWEFWGQNSVWHIERSFLILQCMASRNVLGYPVHLLICICLLSGLFYSLHYSRDLGLTNRISDKICIQLTTYVKLRQAYILYTEM